ncbi:MAG: PaaI family thioesterase [Acidimicrobiales bacterium]
MSTDPRFESYDPTRATAMVGGSAASTGIPAYLGIRIDAVGPGTMTASIEVREEHLNPFGSAHGGTLAALVDHVLGGVLYSVIPPHSWAATTEFKLNFLAPVRVGTLSAAATIESMTRRTAVVRIQATNDGRLVGLAQGTVTIQAPRVEPPAAP